MAVPDATPGAAEPNHIRGGVEIVAWHPIGRGLVVEGGDRTDRHHLAAGIADLESRDVLRGLPERFIALGKDLEGAAQIVEVVHVLRAEVKLQGGEHVGRRQPDLLGLQAVDVGIERGRARVVEGEDAGERRILVGGRYQCIRRIGEGLRPEIVAVLNHQLETASGA
jgi:hypothetical protein